MTLTTLAPPAPEDDVLTPSQLGMHPGADGRRLQVGCYFPGALSVRVVDLNSQRAVATLAPRGNLGYFLGPLGRRIRRFPYRLQVDYPQSQASIIDPHQFGSLLTEQQRYLFAEGKEEHAYRFLGANHRCVQGIDGIWFSLWAPNARAVALIGDFNHWDSRSHPMKTHHHSGIWELFLPQASPGQHYKYRLTLADGRTQDKADPYAREMESPPHNASRIGAIADYPWQDQCWMARRAQWPSHQRPLSIYEVHLASWQRQQDNQPLSYTQLAQRLIPYVKRMGFSHIQLMPIASHPFEGSWGYQPIGLFAPNQRLGDGDALKAFIDQCHQQGIGVILDWVAAHFPGDAHGLAQLDGTALYEHDDPRQGHHPDWDTLLFNYGRNEVKSYLISNAFYWLGEYHFDGLRLDAVSSMLYLDYSREPGQWVPNRHGGRENLDAAELLKQLNQRCHFNFPGLLMIAEESTTWDGITRPVDHGGLGFGYKWNMGWMNDTLRYLNQDPIHRRHHHSLMNFSMLYAYSEHFILSLSHDEVVHGKGSLLSKVPGDPWQKFATLRAYFGFMWTHPGKKLLFMGNELAQWDEWCHQRSLDWHLLDSPPHLGVQHWVRDLNQLYASQGALHLWDHQPQGFQWLECNDYHNSVFSFLRRGPEPTSPLLVIINMTPQVHEQFAVGVPQPGRWREQLNSDAGEYGGSGVTNPEPLSSDDQPLHQMAQRLTLRLPPLSCVILAPESP
ncbi:1,4-alpha-glucan branching protein GlgB [Ferrimonas sp. SCSIO 43195]|uniref:1,4-alpha-glucan branching protein GlgB n=1 Tax=Ferrimonas sp. SCSIO 43195 TaxID=2822844 RepID=UPI0020757152|nr:1,4-alpha-glucan branching protein GlgB [Ferrimonas sp. SCSIO 43195]USD36444.1 1,4-alpha-glucan branching protein GlgB [Ferrimonas sp. SCSIO 43195]